MKVFPHILSRIGGETFDVWNEVDFSLLVKAVSRLHQSQANASHSKEVISAMLLEFIRTLPDTKVQNQLQNLRRDIFNERALKPALLDTCRQLLTPDLNAALDKHLGAVEDSKLAADNFKKVHTDTITNTRRHLQKLSSNEKLLKGLLLSSRTLFDNMKGFRKADPAEFHNREIRAEQSLLKYMTRITTKTSPFSTFNNLAIGTMSNGNTGAIEMSNRNERDDVKSRILLNNYLYEYLRELFKAWQPMYMQLHIRSNPTIINKGDHYLFLTNNKNIEAFQRIPVSPVIGFILECIDEFPEGITFKTLIENMQEAIDASATELVAHVKRLLQLGLIEYDFGVSGIDPQWDIKLIEKLRAFDATGAPLLNDLILVLQRLREFATSYGEADVAGREQILTQAHSMFRDVCMKIHESAGLSPEERKTPEEIAAEFPPKKTEDTSVKDEIPAAEGSQKVETFQHRSNTYFHFKAEQIFYEDTIREIRPQFDRKLVHDFIQTFDSLIGECKLFNGVLDERERISEALKENNAASVPIGLLTFYELYSRETRKAEEEKEKRKGVPPTPEEHRKSLPASTQQRYGLVRSWGDRLMSSISPTIPEAGYEVQLTYQQVKDTNEHLGLDFQHHSHVNSFAMFVQFFIEPDKNGTPVLKGVVNNNFPGHGKMLSRFLHLLPADVVDDIRSWNEALNQGELFIENSDASFFNANLHPPLLPYEIRIPGGHNTLPPSQQLPVSDFEVTLEDTTEKPVLIHKPSGKKSFVFDLGFQGFLGRSPLFRLLNRFSNAQFLMPGGVQPANACWDNIREKLKPGDVKILVRPRVVYEDKIILQRKSWLVPKDFLPFRKKNQDDASYYLTIQEWRTANSIDRHVFVFPNPMRPGETLTTNDAVRKLGKDDYKPQYIDLENPLFILLFEKLIEKVPVHMRVEEMLPSPENLLKIGNERFVTEFLIHWYNYANDTEPKQSRRSDVAVGAN